MEMLKNLKVKTVACAVFVALASQSAVATVMYTPTDLGGGKWKYDIKVTNNTASAVDAFRFIMPWDPFFPPGIFPDTGFSNLMEVSAPSGWYTGVNLEIPFFRPQDYSALNSNNNGIPPGFNSVLNPDDMANVSLTFDWAGAGPEPGAFDWEFFFADPASVPPGLETILASGRATEFTPPPPAENPLPGTLALLGLGLAGLGLRRRRG